MTPERMQYIKNHWCNPRAVVTAAHLAIQELVDEVEHLLPPRLELERLRAMETKLIDNAHWLTLERERLTLERDSLAAKLAVAREALGDIRAYTCANRFEHADTCIEAGYTPCEVCIATEALARIDGDGTEGRGG